LFRLHPADAADFAVVHCSKHAREREIDRRHADRQALRLIDAIVRDNYTQAKRPAREFIEAVRGIYHASTICCLAERMRTAREVAST